MKEIEEMEKGTKLYSSLMFLVAIIWGFGFIATTKVLEAGYSESFMMAFRFTFAAIFFGFLGRKELKKMQKSDVLGGLLSGLSLFFAFAFQTFGLPLTTPSNSAMLTASYIVFVPFFTWLVFRKRPTIRMFMAAALCFIGIYVLSVDGSGLNGFGKGDLLTLLGAMFFAVQAVVMGYFAVRGNLAVLNFFQMLASALFSLVLFGFQGGLGDQIVFQFGLVWILYLSIFSTVIAYLIQTTALKHLPPPRVAIIGAMESVLAAVFSLIFGYDTLAPPLVMGSILVFAAVVLVEIPGKKKITQ